MVHFNIKRQNLELVNLKCVTYAQPIPLSFIEYIPLWKEIRVGCFHGCSVHLKQTNKQTNTRITKMIYSSKNDNCHGHHLLSCMLIHVLYGRGVSLVFQAGYHPRKRLSKHTLNTYFSGMKIDPKYAFLLICVMSFPKFVNMAKNIPFFFQFCTFLHP